MALRLKTRVERATSMSNPSQQIVQRLWNYCNVLLDDGLSYGDYVEQFETIQTDLARR
ncbi:MAG TPA: hypothetical protein VEU33_14350 [Archangium sp.]|nr:hypothetical protein [Archangium sp.]